MSIFSVNKAAKSRAQTAENQAAQEQNTIQLMEFGRDLLQNIRQERIARSQLEFSNYIEGVNTSSAAGALANVDSGLASEVGYAYRYSQHLEDYQNYNRIATEQWEKYAKSVKKAKTNATIAVAAAGAAGGFLLAPAAAAAAAGMGATIGAGTASAIGATAGSMIGAGAVSAIGDNSIASNAAWSQALKTSASAWAQQSFMTPKQAPVADNVTITDASYTGALPGGSTSLQTSYRLSQITGAPLNTATYHGVPMTWNY